MTRVIGNTPRHDKPIHKPIFTCKPLTEISDNIKQKYAPFKIPEHKMIK